MLATIKDFDPDIGVENTYPSSLKDGILENWGKVYESPRLEPNYELGCVITLVVAAFQA